MAIRAIVAGDAEPFLEALTTLLLDLEDRLEILGWARGEREALTLVQETYPDLAFVSSDLPPVDGFRATEQLVAANPTCRVILFGPDASPPEVERALLAGAAGYVTLDPFSIDLIALAVGAQEARLRAPARIPALGLFLTEEEARESRTLQATGARPRPRRAGLAARAFRRSPFQR